MISRVFVCYGGEDNERCYKGFDRRIDDSVVLTAVFVIMEDGDEQVFAIDDTPQARKEFLRYLDDHTLKEHITFLGFFKKE